MVIKLEMNGITIGLSTHKSKNSNAKLSFYDCHRQKTLNFYTDASLYFIARKCKEIEYEITRKMELPSWALFIESITKLW